MGYKSKNTPLFRNNWSLGPNTFGSIFSIRKHKAFSKLKEIYGSELAGANKKLHPSKLLSKEQKRIIKEKIANDYKKQIIKNLFALFLSILITVLIIIGIIYIFKIGFNL